MTTDEGREGTTEAEASPEALAEADLLAHEEALPEVVTAEDVELAVEVTAAAMAADLSAEGGPGGADDATPWEPGPGRAEALFARASARLPRLVVPVTTESVILTALMTIAFLGFLLIEPTPRWLALLGAVVAVLGTDGTLRAARREPFAQGADTTPFLFLPALFALAAPVFLEYNVRGFWAIPAGLAAGLAFGGVVVAEIGSVRADEPLRGPARFYAAAATYFVVFALFSLAYAFDLDLTSSVVAMSLIAVLLSVELLRDDQIDALETLVFASVIGVIVGEARWVLQYMPIDGYLAGLTLLLLFYFATGVAHAYITRQLDRTVAAEYGGVALLGIALVAGVRIAGVA
jgi:hypothetical protein